MKREFLFMYTATENHPLAAEGAAQPSYPGILGQPAVFQALQSAAWNKEVFIAPHFTVRKQTGTLLTLPVSSPFNLVYYDAFAPSAQPELWTEDLFQKLFAAMAPGGVLIT